MYFFNPINTFSSPPNIPWSPVQVTQVMYATQQHRNAFNVHPDEKWFIKKIKNPVYQELYLQLSQDHSMQSFLKEGNIDLFRGSKLIQSTKDKAYFAFWKPFFLHRYAQVLSNAYEKRNEKALSLITSLPFELKKKEQEIAYRDTAQIVQHQLSKLHQIELTVRNEKYIAPSTLERIEMLASAYLLNQLPDYFAGLRESCGEKLIELSMQIFNKGHNNSAAWRLAQLAHRLKVSPEFRDKLDSWNTILDEYIKTSNLLREYRTEIKEQQHNLSKLEKLYQASKTRNISPQALEKKALPYLNPEGLARLPGRFQFFAKDYFAYLRAFSAYSWNEYQQTRQASFFLRRAENLPLTEEQQAILKQDQQDLKNKAQIWKEDIKHAKVEYKESIKVRRASIWPGLFVAALLLGFFSALINNWHLLAEYTDTSPPIAERERKPSYRPPSSTRSYPSPTRPNASTTTPPTESTPDSDASSSTSPRYTPPTIPRTNDQSTNRQMPPEELTSSDDPIQKEETNRQIPGNTTSISDSNPVSISPPIPQTGEKPYEEALGKSEISDVHDNWIQFNNSSSKDVVVLVVDFLTARVTRNAYLRSGESHRMNNIPTGDYLIFFHFGQDWDPEYQVPGTTIQGGFTKNPSYYQVKLRGGRLELYDMSPELSTFQFTIKDPKTDNRLRKMEKRFFFDVTKK